MKDKEYRELQLSSSHLVFIFLSVIALGVIIFLLGISVGKKQASLAAKTEISSVPQPGSTPVESPQPPSAEVKKDTIDQELESHQKIREEQKEPTPVEKPAASIEKNLFYVQIGAYSQKDGAKTFADKFISRGYQTIVLSPFSSDRRPIYRVRVGGYKTREQAVKVKEELVRLDNKKSSDYFVIQD